MANTYSDLTATNVAYNYGKTTPTTQLGTRVLRFVKVTISGGSPPDLTTKDGSGSYTDSQSYYNALVRTMSDYAEIYAMFIPSSTIAVFAIADDTVQDSDTNTNVAGGWGDFEANALAALGSWGSGAVAVTTGTWAGATISWA